MVKTVAIGKNVSFKQEKRFGYFFTIIFICCIVGVKSYLLYLHCNLNVF